MVAARHIVQICRLNIGRTPRDDQNKSEYGTEQQPFHGKPQRLIKTTELHEFDASTDVYLTDILGAAPAFGGLYLLRNIKHVHMVRGK